jgi:NAD(P)H-flavin reductase
MTITHTIRSVGTVSRALHDAQSGAVIGMRGPFGNSLRMAEAVGRDLVIVSGGVGLAPLRPVMLEALTNRDSYRTVTLIAGTRSRDDLFGEELHGWESEGDIDVHRTVDVPVRGWPGEVGFVTEPLRKMPLQPKRTTAFLCGPEPMLRSGANELVRKGMAPRDIRVSLDRPRRRSTGVTLHRPARNPGWRPLSDRATGALDVLAPRPRR